MHGKNQKNLLDYYYPRRYVMARRNQYDSRQLDDLIKFPKKKEEKKKKIQSWK